MAITFGGISSGLPPNIVEQLVEAERMPVRSLEQKKVNSETKLKLVTDFSDKLNKITESIGTLASARGFNDIKLQTGDSNVVQGSVDPASGVNGSWNIEVVELAQKAAAITNGFPDRDRTEIGVGYFRFETADGEKEVYIGGQNNTLESAANAINNSNVGVRATVINDRSNPDEPFRLMLSGNGVGEENEIQYPTLYLLDGDQDIYFEENRPAKNGRVKVDGFEFEVSDNTVKDVIPGVTLELKQASPGRQVNITVKEDQEVVVGKVKEFVDSVNEVLSFIQQQNSMNESSDTSKTLGGDSLLRTVENRLRRLIQNMQVGIPGPIKRLNQIGIEFNRKGTLDYSEDKFMAALSKDPGSVQAFLGGDGFATGFIPNLKREIKTVLDQTFGPVPIRQKALRDQIKRMDDQIESKERQLAKKEQTLRRKFARLEETMSQLKSQGSSLQAMGMSSGSGLNFSGGR